MNNEITPTFHGVDDAPEPCYLNPTESKISYELREAEKKLMASGYKVSRHVRVSSCKPNECYGLSVYGHWCYDLETVRAIVGPSYKLVLNTNVQQILIR